MKKQTILAITILISIQVSAQVGIGTNSPQAMLHVNQGNVLFQGAAAIPANPSSPLPNVTGVSLMFNAQKGSFRAGAADLTWNDNYVGKASVAMGFYPTAKGDNSVAIGYQNAAYGTSSLALGFSSFANAAYSNAIGNEVEATGEWSTAMGNNVTTSLKTGSFIIGDKSTDVFATSTADNQMTMRFAGGYILLTSTNAGIGLPGGGNSWAVVSDKRKKENFISVNGEEVMEKIAVMKLTTWNYKGQDPKMFRHHGPMAQDFHAAFGRDALGTIGNDTTISQSDFDGVNFEAIHALVQRTDLLLKKNSELETEIALLKKQLVLINNKKDRKKVLVAKK